MAALILQKRTSDLLDKANITLSEDEVRAYLLSCFVTDLILLLLLYPYPLLSPHVIRFKRL